MTYRGSGISVVIGTHAPENLPILRQACLQLQQEECVSEILLIADRTSPVANLLEHDQIIGTTLVISEKVGLSSARNLGAQRASQNIVAFIDDDSIPMPGWPVSLIRAYSADSVIGVGGLAIPRWTSPKPRWYHEEFAWVLGCTIGTERKSLEDVRNLLGCNMSFRRDVFDAGLRFREDLGRRQGSLASAEETDFCLRVLKAFPTQRLKVVHDAVVLHSVSGRRTRASYFLRRAYMEGVSKAKFRMTFRNWDREFDYAVNTPYHILADSPITRFRVTFQRLVMSSLILSCSALGFLLGRLAAYGSKISSRIARRDMQSSRSRDND